MDPKSRLYVYDFDDTLVNTHDVLIENDWMDEAKAGALCFADSDIGYKVADLCKPYQKMWKQVAATSKMGDNMILSGRSAKQIAYWLAENKKGNLFDILVGLGTREDVPQKKLEVLQKCASEEYDEIYFYDDKLENIKVAKTVSKVIATHVQH
tara:strand:+ start:60602 stop:61060 length:459 start_codon:yes stop_codon:yes gene_type:complete